MSEEEDIPPFVAVCSTRVQRHGREDACGEKVEFVTFWPGAQPAWVCVKCATRALHVADALGFLLHIADADVEWRRIWTHKKALEAAEMLGATVPGSPPNPEDL